MIDCEAGDGVALEGIRALVAEHVGLEILDHRLQDLAHAVYKRVETLELDCAALYLQRLVSTSGKADELLALVQALTVGETYFFRYLDQLRVLVEVALPDCLQARGDEAPVRVLSAGCSTGEEPYTVAMLLRTHFPRHLRKRIEIKACDLNMASLDRAVAGRYARWALRETSPAIREQFFDPDEKESILKPEVRRMVSFEHRNLASDDSTFWYPATFDIILFRNVSIYFTPQATIQVLTRMTRALRPGGYLFLGHSETLTGRSTAFDLRHTHGAFYFQLRKAVDPVVSGERTTTMIEDRVTAEPVAPPDEALLDCGQVLALIHLQQSVEALRLIEGGSPAERQSAEVQTMLAVILTNRGDVAGARRVCERLLASDSMSAAAHYLLAICLEHAGDRAGAVVESRMASHLDPDFAMPLMHVGLMSRRLGDCASALAALERAVELFALEDISRIMLFGGGFNREVLIRLCRSEINACRGIS